MQTDNLFYAVKVAADKHGIRDREGFFHGIAGYLPAISGEDPETQGAFITGFADCWKRIEAGGYVVTI